MPGMGHEKADIIFAALPSHLDFVARILRKLGYRVFYLALSHPGQSAQAERQRANMLRETGIALLPLENCPRLTGVLQSYNDPDKKFQEKADRLAPNSLLRTFQVQRVVVGEPRARERSRHPRIHEELRSTLRAHGAAAIRYYDPTKSIVRDDLGDSPSLINFANSPEALLDATVSALTGVFSKEALTH